MLLIWLMLVQTHSEEDLEGYGRLCSGPDNVQILDMRRYLRESMLSSRSGVGVRECIQWEARSLWSLRPKLLRIRLPVAE